MRKIGTALLAVATLAACSGDSGGADVTRVDIEEAGGTWPLTVDSGRIGCEDGGGLTFTSDEDDVTYALNGAAPTTYQPIDPIWADNQDVDGLKVDMSGLLAYGEEACED